MQPNLTNNNVTLTGVIDSPFTFSHKVYDEGFYTFYVSVSRLSEAYDRIPITISERLVNIEKLPMGVQVAIEGQLRSYNSYDTEYKRNKLILTVFTKELTLVTEPWDIEDPSEPLYLKSLVHSKTPNEIMLNGYICKPPVFRTTPFGREITDILLAVNRSYNKSDYIPCIAWGRNARYIANMAVGDNIKIYGRIQSRVYQKRQENGDTQEKTAYEVSVSKVEVASDIA